MTVATGIEVAQDKIADVCRRYQIVELSIFGSAARGEARPNSDIDVLVEFAPEAVRGWDYFALEQELAQIFGRRVDLATKKWLKPNVRFEILQDARIVYAA